MSNTIAINNGVITSHLEVDHSPGDRDRTILRDHAKKDLSSPWNEGFSFTEDEWELLRRTRPALFDEDPVRRFKAWRAWATTAEGRAFRVK